MFQLSVCVHLIIIFGLHAFLLFKTLLRQSNNPTSPVTFISNYFLLLTIFYNVYFAFFSPPRNLFQFLGVSEDAPLFLIRNKLQGYVETQPLSEQTIDLLWFLYNKLKSNQNRQVYCFFGEHALLNCIWCREDFDYIMFILPFLVASYLCMFLLVWFVSIPSQRAYVRSYSTMFLIILGFFDFLAFSHGFKSCGISVTFTHSTMDCYRRIAFAVMALGLWYVGYAGDAQERRSLKLIRSLSLADPVLRPKFLEQAKLQKVATKNISECSEYNKKWAEISLRIIREEILKNAQMANKTMLQNAFK